jgi:hypothetical protein
MFCLKFYVLFEVLYFAKRSFMKHMIYIIQHKVYIKYVSIFDTNGAPYK